MIHEPHALGPPPGGCSGRKAWGPALLARGTLPGGAWHGGLREGGPGRAACITYSRRCGGDGGPERGPVVAPPMAAALLRLELALRSRSRPRLWLFSAAAPLPCGCETCEAGAPRERLALGPWRGACGAPRRSAACRPPGCLPAAGGAALPLGPVLTRRRPVVPARPAAGPAAAPPLGSRLHLSCSEGARSFRAHSARRQRAPALGCWVLSGCRPARRSTSSPGGCLPGLEGPASLPGGRLLLGGAAAGAAKRAPFRFTGRPAAPAGSRSRARRRPRPAYGVQDVQHRPQQVLGAGARLGSSGVARPPSC